MMQNVVIMLVTSMHSESGTRGRRLQYNLSNSREEC